MRLRKDVNAYLYYLSKRFFQVTVELKNVPGALQSVLDVLKGLNINVLGSFSSVTAYARSGEWSAFVEDSRHTASELKEKISFSKYVLDSIVVESKDGFLADSIHFPVSWNTGDRAVMWRAEFLKGMLERVREEFGTGGEVIIFDEGYASGKGSLTEFTARLGADFVRSHLRDILMMYQALGWFKLEEVNQSGIDRSVTIRTSGSFECEGVNSAKPHSHLVRGHLCGGVAAILGEPMECKEVRCMAVGDKQCEFVLTPKGAVGRRPERMRALVTGS